MKKKYESQNLLQKISEKDTFTKVRYAQFYSHFNKSSKHILDLGCNTGTRGSVLKKIDNNLIIDGLDVVKQRLDKIIKKNYNKIYYSLSTKIPQVNNYYDCILLGEVIEHIYEDDIDKTFIEFFRVLKIGGKILLTTPNPLDIKKKIKKESILGGPHVSQHYPHILKLRLKMHGFSNIKIRGTGKVSKYLGPYFPIWIYGSYLISATKF